MTDLPPGHGDVASARTGNTVSRDTSSTASPAQGVALAMGAFGFWSLFPLVFKTVAHISPLEVLAHRSLWSLVFAGLLMVVLGRREIFQKAFYARHIVLVAAMAGAAVAVNWGVFIWAVANNQVLQSSLGYYISPLVSVVFGVIFFGERLRKAAWVAIAFALAGVGLMVWLVGVVPWVSLALAVSWSTYGLVRKRARVGSLPGLFLETLMLSPLALGYVLWLGWGYSGGNGGGGMFGTGIADTVLLIASGALTALPLLLYARAARILKLSTLGVLTFLVPTGQFLLAVLVFDEPFGQSHLWAFVLIWTGLIVYATDSVRASRKGRTIPQA